MKTKLRVLVMVFCMLFLCVQAYAQTALAAGDIAIIWNQTDTPDDFAFVTFVDLDEGTVIYFTDCGADAAGFATPCNEGAQAYTVPAGGHDAGEIFKFQGNPNFASYTDSRITGSFGTSTAGDQILVFQDPGGLLGSNNAGNNPLFIFASNTSATTFAGNKADSNQTGLPAGLQNTTAPVTALGLGAGPVPQDEVDNAIYNGTYTFTDIPAAKLALTNASNYYTSNPNPPGLDATYDAAVAAIPLKLNLTSLSVDSFDMNTAISVYPNPSNGLITIKNTGVSLQAVMVTDVNGRTVANYLLEGERGDLELDLRSTLSSGMYFLNIASDQASTIKKIMIN